MAIDLGELEKQFSLLASVPYIPPVEPQAKAKAEPHAMPSTSGTTPDASLKPRKVQLKDYGVLVSNGSNHSEFIINIVDKVMQQNLCSLGGSNTFESSALAFVADLRAVGARLRDTLPASTEGSPSFVDLLGAVEAVFRCFINDKGGVELLPSDLRAANQLIHTAHSQKPAFKLATAMNVNSLAKRATESARSKSAVGLQDQTTDELYDKMHDMVESRLAICYEKDPEAWATSAASGGPFTMSSYDDPLELTTVAMVNLSLVLGQWSDMRLEERCPEVALMVNALAMILKVGSFAVGMSFQLHVPEVVELLTVFGGDVDQQVQDDPASRAAQPQGEGDEALQDDATTPLPADSDDNKKDMEGRRIEAFKNMFLAMQKFKAASTEFMGRVCDLSEQLSVLANKFTKRLGPKFQNELEVLSIDLPANLEESWENKQLIETICNYSLQLATLAEQAPLSEEDIKKPVIEKEGYLQGLSAFCAAHRVLHDGQTETFKIGFPYDSLAHHLILPKLISGLTKVGDLAFKKHSVPALQALTVGLRALEVQANVVCAGQLQAHAQADALFPMMVSNPTASALCLNVPDKADTTSDVINNMSPQVLMANLRLLVDALDVQRLAMPGIAKAAGDITGGMDLEDGMKYFELVSSVHTLVACAAALHVRLAEPIARHQVISDDEALRRLPTLLGALGDALSNLDKCCSDPKAKQVEGQGWVLPLSFAMGRMLVDNMTCFRKRMVSLLLGFWAGLMATASTRLTSCCPSLGSCIGESTFDEELAIEVTKDKLPALISGHNGLHNLLSTLGSAADTFCLSPRLQDHPETKGPIAVARHALQLAKDATIVVRGVALLQKVKMVRDGPAQIKKFLAGVPEHERSGISQGFWTHFTAFAMSSEGPKGAPDNMADGSYDAAGSDSASGAKAETSAGGMGAIGAAPKAQRPFASALGNGAPASAAPLKRRRQQ